MLIAKIGILFFNRRIPYYANLELNLVYFVKIDSLVRDLMISFLRDVLAHFFQGSLARRHFPLTVVRRGQSVRRRQIWHVRRNGDQDETPRIGDSSSDLKQIYVVQSNSSRGERVARGGHGKLTTKHLCKHPGFLGSRSIHSRIASLHF